MTFDETLPNAAWQLLVVSADTPAEVADASAELRAAIDASSERPLAEIAHDWRVGRTAKRHRRIAVCRDRSDAVATLAGPGSARQRGLAPAAHPEVVFLVPGRTSRAHRMMAGLYVSEPVFRHHVDECARVLRELGRADFRDLLVADDSAATRDGVSWMADHSIYQAALFAVEYGLGQLWMSWGVQPSAMAGHSSGEVVVACLAGVLSLRDALRLMTIHVDALRSLRGGAMLAVAASEDVVAPLLADGRVSVAAVNAPHMCVLSGDDEAIVAAEAVLVSQHVVCSRLPFAEATHSDAVEPLVPAMVAKIGALTLRPPRVPFVSCVTGAWITPAEATDPVYWATLVRRTVRFGDAMAVLLRGDDRVFLEIGPGTALSALARQQSLAVGRVIAASASVRSETRPDRACLLDCVGRLWLAGVQFDWTRFGRCEDVALDPAGFHDATARSLTGA